jgi:hypothetical protein
VSTLKAGEHAYAATEAAAKASLISYNLDPCQREIAALLGHLPLKVQSEIASLLNHLPPSLIAKLPLGMQFWLTGFGRPIVVAASNLFPDKGFVAGGASFASIITALHDWFLTWPAALQSLIDSAAYWLSGITAFTVLFGGIFVIEFLIALAAIPTVLGVLLGSLLAPLGL